MGNRGKPAVSKKGTQPTIAAAEPQTGYGDTTRWIPNAECQVIGIDKIYERWLGNRASGCFVEVGAFDCQRWSNVSMLAGMGWRGLVIEPMGHYNHECLKAYENDEQVVVVSCAISDHQGLSKLFLGGTLSAISEEQVDTYRGVAWAGDAHRKQRYVVVATYPLDDILEFCGTPKDFEVLSVDAEGSEVDVLNGFDIGRWRPLLVIIEAHEHAEPTLQGQAKEINDYFAQYGYAKIYSDPINNVYVRQDLAGEKTLTILLPTPAATEDGLVLCSNCRERPGYKTCFVCQGLICDPCNFSGNSSGIKIAIQLYTEDTTINLTERKMTRDLCRNCVGNLVKRQPASVAVVNHLLERFMELDGH